MLAKTDLKTRLLPDKWVLSLALLGITFHTTSMFFFATPVSMIEGALIGGGLLYILRMIGNLIYKKDTLGLGDVKLMAAAGIWLGPEHILTALVWGALAGLLHGGVSYGYEKMTQQSDEPLSTYSVPAGPGFIVGILIAALAKFWSLPHFQL